MNPKLSKLVDDGVKLKDVIIGKDVTREEYIQLINLMNVKHGLDAVKAETEEKIKKIRPMGPSTLIFKPILFKSRKNDLEELDEECAKPQGKWSNTNHFKTIFGDKAARKSGAIIKVCTMIIEEVRYFRNRDQKVAFFTWLRAEHPERLKDYKKNCICGKANLAKLIRYLKKKYVGIAIKGFRMFIKKYYRPLERVAVRTPSGHVTFIPINIK